MSSHMEKLEGARKATKLATKLGVPSMQNTLSELTRRQRRKAKSAAVESVASDGGDDSHSPGNPPDKSL